MTRLARHYTQRMDYRAGELCEAEELQREEPQRNWLFILTWLVGFPVIVAGEIALLLHGCKLPSSTK